MTEECGGEEDEHLMPLLASAATLMTAKTGSKGGNAGNGSQRDCLGEDAEGGCRAFPAKLAGQSEVPSQWHQHIRITRTHLPTSNLPLSTANWLSIEFFPFPVWIQQPLRCQPHLGCNSEADRVSPRFQLPSISIHLNPS